MPHDAHLDPSSDTHDGAHGPKPHCSVVMAARNAADTIEEAVAAVFAQDYAGPVDMVVAVAPPDESGDDGTMDILRRLAAAEPRLRVVDNPQRLTPAGLNRAIGASQGSIIVRCDAHAVLPPDYVRVAVETMAITGAANVGGIQHAEGTATFERAVALAMTSRFGVGDSRFHYGGAAGPSDTVYLGVFDRAALDAVGGFDETYVRNQDYELNHRLREAGGVVWFTPDLSVRYKPRSSIRSLARQYFDYGRWKRAMLAANPGALRARQLAPPLLVGGLVVSAIAAMTPLSWLAWWLPALYLGFLALAAVVAFARAPSLAALLQPVALATMHLSWGAGYWTGVTRHATTTG